MTRPPANAKLYHITHVDNLAAMAAATYIYSDAKRIALGLETNVVGMSKIKKRRLNEIEVACHAGTMVGQYVPFYYCPRSVMLYILHKGNHPDLDYTEGQDPIVHLQVDLEECLDWAQANDVRWAISPVNAGARYADFYKTRAQLDEIDWIAVANRDFRSPAVKEKKQAEFLVYGALPWSLVEHIGVFDAKIGKLARSGVGRTGPRPTIRVENSWYY
jgi:hypothetical protein